MAPIKNILAALALASITTAIPVALDKRANTVTETTWTTVDVTTTVYVDEASPMPKVDDAPPAAPAVTTAAAAAPESSPAAASPEAPAPSSAGNAPAAFAEQAAPPAEPTTAVVSSAAPVASSAAAPASSAAPQAKAAGSSSGSGPCEGPGSGCSGDGTHWDGGLGACGWNVDTASDLSIALPVGLMGAQSNGNPYCGRSVSIKGSNGQTVSATVGDKCMGCEGDSIDMTDALFAAAFPSGDGRVSGVEWWFT